jgi:NAD(P)-dependent dehydrogenase (short-subunit alcohol dehydrogenase family)
VIVASNASLLRDPWPGYYAYYASKAATQHLSRVLGTTLSQAKIRVNTLSPGPFLTEMTQGDPHLETMGDSLPAGRMGNEQEMANAILVSGRELL